IYMPRFFHSNRLLKHLDEIFYLLHLHHPVSVISYFTEFREEPFFQGNLKTNLCVLQRFLLIAGIYLHVGGLGAYLQKYRHIIYRARV
ncbi:MAG: hypothetical protein WDA65_06790, partial [Christensenellales bacterium]